MNVQGSGVAEKIIFGTMRMREQDTTVAYWSEYFVRLHTLGIRYLHSSMEYESFGLLCETLGRVSSEHPEVRFKHIVKLAEPDFDDIGFCGERLQEKVNSYFAALGVVKIECVQWMWRSGLKHDSRRCEQVIESAQEVTQAVEQLKQAGKIETLACFPYTPAFAAVALELPFIDGVAVYRNPLEGEYDHVLGHADSLGKYVIVIRPFAGGKAIVNDRLSPSSLLYYALEHPVVQFAIVTISTIHHLETLGLTSVAEENDHKANH